MADGSFKRRNLIFVPSGTAIETLRDNNGNVTTQTSAYSISGRQETYSGDNSWIYGQYRAMKDHPNPLVRRNVRNWDIGSNFFTVRHEHEWSSDWVIKPETFNIGGYRSYKGPLFARASVVGPGSSEWPAIPSLALELKTLGTTAIARTIPTNPAAGAAQFLGELREGLPSVPGRHLATSVRNPSGKSLSKGSADEYLNLEFGLKPIISDLKKFAQASKDANKILAQLKRDSGRRVRRRYRFPTTTDTTTRVFAGGQYPSPVLNTWQYGTSGKLTLVTTTKKERWFSGAYTYLYEEPSSLSERLMRAEQRLNAVYGARLNPELLWELMPWSWAVDWVSNTGDVIHNLSAFSRDGLVLCYGYMMGTTTVSNTYTLEGVSFQGGRPFNLSQTFRTIRKERVAATPYGFGLDTSGFTNRQWAILGALGISKASGL